MISGWLGAILWGLLVVECAVFPSFTVTAEAEYSDLRVAAVIDVLDTAGSPEREASGFDALNLCRFQFDVAGIELGRAAFQRHLRPPFNTLNSRRLPMRRAGANIEQADKLPRGASTVILDRYSYADPLSVREHFSRFQDARVFNTNLGLQGFPGEVQLVFRRLGRLPRIVSSSDGSQESPQNSSCLELLRSGLRVSQLVRRFGGFRHTTLLDEIILIVAMLLGFFGAMICLHTSLRPGQPTKRIRATIGAAGVICSPFLLYPFLSGWLWLPWL